MIPLVTALAVAVGLTLDATLPFWGHLAADGVVLACWLVVFRVATRDERRGLIACVVLATLGELFLCYGWGLYEYRYGNIPVFVPLGHSMIFLSGCRLAPKAPRGTWQVVVAVTVPAVVVLAVTGVDTAGLLWLPMFLACLIPKGTRHLYGTMFPVALAVEIAGTQVGSWWWFPEVPWVSLSSTNPPLCAGVFYCVLDLLVIVTGHFAWGVDRSRIRRLLAQGGRGPLVCGTHDTRERAESDSRGASGRVAGPLRGA